MSTIVTESVLVKTILEFIHGMEIVGKRDFSAEAEQLAPRLVRKGKASKIDVLRALQDVSFYDDDFEGMSEAGLDSYSHRIALSRFKDAILSQISPVEPIVLERQASPGLEAYDHIGNNRTDHTPSGITYGLLYE